MSTEELIEQLKQLKADIDAILDELRVHQTYSIDMLPAVTTNRIARVKTLVIPFGIDTSTWAG